MAEGRRAKERGGASFFEAGYLEEPESGDVTIAGANPVIIRGRGMGD